jgi:hypothetical protein
MALTKVTKSGITNDAIDGAKLENTSITSADIAPGTLTNAKLENSSVTVNGTSVSLGGSVDTTFISWQSVITADGSTTTTAVAGNGYFIDTTSAAHTINLPASPSAGDTVAIKDYAGTFGTNAVTIGRNSENIQGVANNSELSTNRASVILVYADATKGWLYSNESNVGDLQQATFISATGGTETTSGDYKIHTFTGDGCFVVSSLGNPVGGGDTVSYLVIAGGAGGQGGGGAGAGAGGVREGRDIAPSYTASPIVNSSGLTLTATTYPVTVGAGGAGGATGPGPKSSRFGGNGSNSIFSTITSAGGGRGGGQGDASPNCDVDGVSGGSGGGAGQNSGPPPRGVVGAGNTPPVSPPQGNPGGQGNYAGNTPGSGGGGGAGATGGSAGGPGVAGDGGAGVTTSISGSPTAYGGGGGGTACAIHGVSADGGTGGTGGGGNASTGNGAGSSGTANTGGGGGAGGSPGFCGGSCNPGGSGGKGLVVIRYKYQ